MKKLTKEEIIYSANGIIEIDGVKVNYVDFKLPYKIKDYGDLIRIVGKYKSIENAKTMAYKEYLRIIRNEKGKRYYQK
jgi:hypothetical protein